MLLSRANYVNLMRAHDRSMSTMPSCLIILLKILVICNRLKIIICTEEAHGGTWEDLEDADPINTIKDTEFSCHICLKPMKSKVDLELSCPVGWSSRIHHLHLSREVRPHSPNENTCWLWVATHDAL